eukprot:7380187-Prymnesium_polylepis.1
MRHTRSEGGVPSRSPAGGCGPLSFLRRAARRCSSLRCLTRIRRSARSSTSLSTERSWTSSTMTTSKLDSVGSPSSTRSSTPT